MKYMNMGRKRNKTVSIDPAEILIEIGAAWNTYQSGFLKLDEFAAVMAKYENVTETFANKKLEEFK